jgi:hypothetical protein
MRRRMLRAVPLVPGPDGAGAEAGAATAVVAVVRFTG